MGYNYTIQGWYKCRQRVDLRQLAPQPTAGYVFSEHDALENWMRVTGESQNYISFATQSKWCTNYYLAALSEVIRLVGPGTGLLTITGEWSYDGKDHFILALEGSLFTLPTIRIYDPLSPWNSVYRWSHYMGREPETLTTIDRDLLTRRLESRHSVKGWIYLHRVERRGEELATEIRHNYSLSADGVGFMNQYSEPYLLFGAGGVDAAAIVLALAEITSTHPRSYGLAYCSTSDERSQTPVAIENGRTAILPEVRLDQHVESGLLPTKLDGFAGLGPAFQALPVRSDLELDSLHAKLREALSAPRSKPASGYAPDRRPPLRSTGPSYLFADMGLTLLLVANEGQNRANSCEDCPSLLVAWMEGEEDPHMLKQLVERLIGILNRSGIDVAREFIYPGFTGP